MMKVSWKQESCNPGACGWCTRVCAKGAISISGGECHYCVQCDPQYAECLRACARGALWADKEGTIRVDADKCDGCGACERSCHYNGIKVKGSGGARKAVKCDPCKSLGIEKPVCVGFCPRSALTLFEAGEPRPLAGERASEFQEQVEQHSIEFVGDGKRIPAIASGPHAGQQELGHGVSFKVLQLPNGKSFKVLQEYGRVTIGELQGVGKCYVVSFPKLFAFDWHLAAQVKGLVIKRLSSSSLAALAAPARYFDASPRKARLAEVKRIALEFCNRVAPALEPERKDALAEIVAVDIAGFGPIEFLWAQDKDNLEEIEVNHPLEEIRVYHKKHGRCLTNLAFRGEKAFRKTVNKILWDIGKTLDASHSSVDAQLPDGSRLHAQVSPSALSGAMLSVRMPAREPWTITKLISNGTLSAEMAAYIWMAIEMRKAQIVIAGPPAAGKSTLLSALLAFQPKGEKVISIEEEISELRFYKNFTDWLPLSGVVKSRKEDAGRAGRETTNVQTCIDQVKNSLRSRPDRIVLGELRAEEAQELFAGANLGIPFLTTLHANEFGTAIIKRLRSPPMNVPVDTVSMLDIVVTLSTDAEKKRRVMQLSEICWKSRGNMPPEVSNSLERGKLEGLLGKVWEEGGEAAYVNNLWSFDPGTKEFEKNLESRARIISEFARHFAMGEKEARDELRRRADVLEALAKGGTVSFEAVGNALHEYSTTPQDKRRLFIARAGRVWK